jgi:hypothetical protein
MQAQTLADAAHATTGRPSLPYPVAAHPFGRLLHTQQFQSETDQPFRVHMVDDHQEQAGAGIAFGEQVFALPESSPGGSPHQSLQFRFREVREQRSFPENCSSVANHAQAFKASSYRRLPRITLLDLTGSPALQELRPLSIRNSFREGIRQPGKEWF